MKTNYRVVAEQKIKEIEDALKSQPTVYLRFGLACDRTEIPGILTLPIADIWFRRPGSKETLTKLLTIAVKDEPLLYRGLGPGVLS